MFFKSNKTVKTEDLKLSDFDKIWTKFCFLDETGSLSNPDESLFTIGTISYDLKLLHGFVKDGSVYKTQLVEYLKKKLGVQSDFQKGFRNHNFNIFVVKVTHIRLPISVQKSEKGLST